MVREAVPPPGNARRDLDILFDLSKRLGYPMPHTDAADVMDEIAELTPQLARHLARRASGTQGLQWPVPTKDHPGTPVLYDRDASRRRAGAPTLFAVDWEPPGESASAELPVHPHHRPPARALQLGHADAAHRERRAAAGGPRRDPSRRRRSASASPTATCVEIESARGKVADMGVRHDARRARQRVPLVPLPRGEDEPAHERQRRSRRRSCPEYKVTAVDVRKVPGEHPPPPRDREGLPPGRVRQRVVAATATSMPAFGPRPSISRTTSLRAARARSVRRSLRCRGSARISPSWLR